MKFKAVLFDFDGVLLDSLALHLLGWKHATKEVFNLEMTEEELRAHAGMSTRTIGQSIANAVGRSTEADELIYSKINFIQGHAAILFEGAKDALQLAKDRCQYSAIVSNAPHNFISRNLTYHGVSGIRVFGLEDHPEPKPSPLAYISAAQTLGIDVTDFSKVVVLEDSKHGLIAGLQAGMFGVGISTHLSQDELTQAGAHAVFSSAKDALTQLL